MILQCFETEIEIKLIEQRIHERKQYNLIQKKQELQESKQELKKLLEINDQLKNEISEQNNRDNDLQCELDEVF